MTGYMGITDVGTCKGGCGALVQIGKTCDECWQDRDRMKREATIRAAGIEEGRRQERDERMAAFLEWRGIETACVRCQGGGVRAYGDTSTWHGGIGGQMITRDVCDACWGTGDANRKGVDLRRLYLMQSTAEAAKAEGRRQMKEEAIASVTRCHSDGSTSLLSAVKAIEAIPVGKDGT